MMDVRGCTVYRNNHVWCGSWCSCTTVQPYHSHTTVQYSCRVSSAQLYSNYYCNYGEYGLQLYGLKNFL